MGDVAIVDRGGASGAFWGACSALGLYDDDEHNTVVRRDALCRIGPMFGAPICAPCLSSRPFDTLPIHRTSIAVYQLGNNGDARKEL